MNTRIKILTAVSTTILAGAITASGQPQERRQRQQQSAPRLGAEQTCPTCGAPQRNQQQRSQVQRHGFSQQRSNTGQQYRRQDGLAQNRQFNPQQRRSSTAQFQGRNQLCGKPDRHLVCPDLSILQQRLDHRLLVRELHFPMSFDIQCDRTCSWM